MKNRSRQGLLFSVLITTILLTACQSWLRAAPATSVPNPTLSGPTRTTEATYTATSTSTPTAKPSLQPTIRFTQSPPAICEVTPVIPEVSPEIEKLIPSPGEDDRVYGPEDARVTVYFYSDFQCSICAGLGLNLRALQEQYPEDVRVVHRYLLLTSENDKALLAAQAAEAAGLQDQYWQMHDLLYSSFNTWVALSKPEFVTWLVQQAGDLDLNVDQFEQDLESEKIHNIVQTANQAALNKGLTHPPALFFNKAYYDKWWDLSSLVNMVGYFKLSERTYDACPVLTLDPAKEYTATLKTEKGEIVIELYPQIAPMAVKSFIFLVNEGWYDGSTFYRVIPGFLAQTGDPTGSGFGKPGYQFTNEVSPDLRFDQPGRVAMARSDETLNGSQFFITYTAIPEFDGKYTIFGQVIEGMDVLESLRPRNPDFDQVLFQADPMISITLEER